jgi:hypothetical protein
MAMSNIKQRYELAYGGRAAVNVESGTNEFRVLLTFPYEVSLA